MKGIAAAVLIGSLPLAAGAALEAEVLGGVSQHTNGMAFYGYLYVPTCEVSTSRIEGGLLENGGGPLAGSHTLRFTEMSGGRWASKSPGEVLQDGLINVVLNNCTLSQLRLQLQAGETDSDPAPGAETGVGGAFIGAMTYQGIPSAQPEVDWGNDDPRWGDERDVSSSRWLYYTVGAGDAMVGGAGAQRRLRLKKESSAMQCTAAEYCLLKLDNSTYLFNNEWGQEKVNGSGGEWEGAWSDATSLTNDIQNLAPAGQGYLPSNLVNATSLTLPLHVRLHHGSRAEAKTDVPRGEYAATLTLTLSFD